MRHRVSVLLPVAIDAAYTYAADEPLAPGTIVEVPLGPRRVLGAVWEDPPDETIGHNRLRAVAAVVPVPPIDAEMRAFVEWVARWTVSPRGMVLRMALRAPQAYAPEPPRPGVRRAGPPPERFTPARARVLALTEDGLSWSRTGLAAAAGVSVSVVDGLVAAGSLEVVMMAPTPIVATPDEALGRAPTLSPEQAAAAAALTATVRAGGFSVTLIDGVTGSGKTDVFLEAVAETIRQGSQALVLMPEIALTQAVLSRFEERFAAKPGEWHSAVPAAQRGRVWRGVAEGSVPCVVGARSALFLPFKRLGLVVVDEEHEVAYKQDDRVPYNARDMAVVRGRIGAFPVVLSSATPSVESRVNADAGRYKRLVLGARTGGGALPNVAVIDLRRAPPERGRWLSPPLVNAVAHTLARGEQALLFLNRRGYAPLTLCGACGHRFQCPQCSAWLVDHRLRDQLVCHHCGHTEKRPDACPACGAEGRLVACGPGVERVAEEAAERFPQARLLVLSSDTGGTERIRREFALVAEGKVDLVVGTQLVAKGHTFPKLTLVGVVDADIGLVSGDPRAAERTFQLLSQVTGRAGRTGKAGVGLLQTHTPDHPVMRALVAGDSDAFYAAEIEARRRTGLPPFGRLAAIVVSGPDRPATEAYARALARAAPAATGAEVLGPAEAALAVLRGRYRFRLLVKASRSLDLPAYLRAWLAAAPPPRGGLDRHVDVEPQSFL
jgi:primosomal protein N' (replication factor Y)